jgi:hypothetical protein
MAKRFVITLATCASLALCAQEGTLDTRCADQAFIAFGMVAKGCCKSTGKCGLMLTRIGLGCVERTAIPAWASSGGEWIAALCTDADSGM